MVHWERIKNILRLPATQFSQTWTMGRIEHSPFSLKGCFL